MRRPAILAVVLLLGFPVRSEGASLKVSPGRFTVHNVEPGREYDLYRETGVRVSIYNDDETARSWALSTHRPSERGRWEKGYAEIPDPRWCRPEQPEVTVAPNTRAYVNLHLEVPDEEEYYNQHWVVTMAIGSKRGSGPIAVGVDVRVLIETKERTRLSTRPDGLLGIVPSMVRFEDMVPGTGRSARLAIYNNAATTRDYTITPLFEDSTIEQKTYLTHSYKAIPVSRWITVPKKVRIESGETAQLPVELNIPGDGAYSDQKWESILLVQPDEGRAGFARVQVETMKKAD